MDPSDEASPTVLVVDDDSSYCTIIRELLVRNGYQVRLAYGAEQAFDLLQHEQPDLILTDLMMPEVDGLAFIKRLRSSPAQASIPTIVVSALVLARERAAAAQAGADGFVAKPFSIKQLRAAIKLVMAPVRSQTKKRRQVGGSRSLSG